MSISQNAALFSLFGTQYGGDGRSTFGLPDLRGRAPVCVGQGPGLSAYTQGQMSGEATHTLTTQEMPMHNHALNGDGVTANLPGPGGNMFGKGPGRTGYLYGSSSTAVAMVGTIMQSAGSSQAHDNMQPFLVLNFIIALQGIFPPRP